MKMPLLLYNKVKFDSMKGLNKNFMPISMDITGKTILILGGGNTAFKKIMLLRKYTNRFYVIAQKVNEDIKALGIPWSQKTIDKDDLSGFHILYSCTNNRSLNKKIAEWGHEFNILVNIHDDPELCDFVSPAIYKKDNISISVSTNGEDALMAIKIRDGIQNIIKKENLLG